MNDMIKLFSIFHGNILQVFDSKPLMPSAKEYLCNENYFLSLWTKL